MTVRPQRHFDPGTFCLPKEFISEVLNSAGWFQFKMSKMELRFTFSRESGRSVGCGSRTEWRGFKVRTRLNRNEGKAGELEESITSFTRLT